MSCTKLAFVLLGMVAVASACFAQETKEPKWTGQVSGGWTSTRGNSVTDSLSASASAEKRREMDRISLGADYANGRQTVGGVKTTSADWWRAMGKYDYFFAPQWYGFGNARYESDKIALLDYRLTVGAGLGHQLIENDRTSFSLEAGLAHQTEEFDTTPGTSSDQVAGQAGYRLTHQIVETVDLIHDLTYYPSLEGSVSDYYLTTSGELRAHFTETMFSSFKAILNRDATPAAGQAQTDTKFIISVGMTF